MLPSEFAEDVFVEFYNLVAQQKISIQGQDFSPISSFHEKIINGSELTKNQANFLIKLLEKYKTMSAMAGFDYRPQLQDINWRRGFRVLDLSKSIYVELRENKLEICLKFPYQLKKEFEDEIERRETLHAHSFWDTDDKKGWIKFGVFLCSAGREIWSVDDASKDSEIKSMLEGNGFPVVKITRMPSATFVHVDHNNLKLSDFYLWSEVYYENR
jgi:hypothetical protein